MLKGLYTAYTGMVNEQHRMDTLTNNLANSATTGYKKEGATSQSFHDVFAYKIKDVTEAKGVARRLGAMSMGVKVGENYTDHQDGPMTVTNNPYDMAITGPGFFSIEFTNKAGVTSTKYTRDGNFTLTEEGYLVTKDGDFVLDDRGRRIELDPLLTSEIKEDGRILQDGNTVATIGITDFEDYNYLEHYGENLFQPVDGYQEKDAEGRIISGYLERSNVQVVKEMVEMINVSRAYETNQKIVQTYDSSLEIAVNQLGRLNG
ncbi:flagellar basal-body rod protein FlgF [Lachnospiraceae bacterium JLR.KK008]